MTRLLTICFALILAFIGCKKETNFNVQDSIVYTELMPVKEANSINRWEPVHLWSTDLEPIPGDSNSFVYLNIDGDSTIDFKIDTRHWTESTSSAAVPIIYPTQITLSSMHPGAFINIKNDGSPYTMNYNLGEFPSHTSSTWICGDAFGYQNYVYLGFNHFDDTYWAIEVDGKKGWIHIERTDHSAFMIDSYAYNMTPDRPIFMGRVE